MKKCSKCGETKELTEFHKDRGNKDGLCWWCKVCKTTQVNIYTEANRDKVYAGNRAYGVRYPRRIRNKNLLQAFGITLDQYETMLAAQGGVCAICEQAETEIHPRSKKIRNYAVDHDHITGDVRGLLCNACNRGLGLLGDTAERLRKAVAYTEKPPRFGGG